MWPVLEGFVPATPGQVGPAALEVDAADMPRAMDLERLHAELSGPAVRDFAGVTLAGGRLVISFRRTPTAAARTAALARVKRHAPAAASRTKPEGVS